MVNSLSGDVGINIFGQGSEQLQVTDKCCGPTGILNWTGEADKKAPEATDRFLTCTMTKDVPKCSMIPRINVDAESSEQTEPRSIISTQLEPPKS